MDHSYMLRRDQTMLQEISGKFSAIESGGRLVLNEPFSVSHLWGGRKTAQLTEGQGCLNLGEAAWLG